MGNPWNGKVVLETFWSNCWNDDYPADWYTYLAKLAPRLAKMGFDAVQSSTLTLDGTSVVLSFAGTSCNGEQVTGSLLCVLQANEAP